MLELTVTTPQTLKEFTENNYAQAAFYFTWLLKNKEIKVNGKKVGENVVLKEGDTVRYYLTKKQEETPAFYAVYEDENIFVADKESGVNAEAVFAALARSGDYRFIHRIDRNTKGLLVFAKNGETETALLQAFKERAVEKTYHALCFGALPKANDLMTAYLKKDEKNALVQVYARPTDGAEKIVTEYKTLERVGETTKIEVTLHTGKTHQIRAHFAFIGCPLVGDMKYGDTAKNRALNATRQRLVAKRLAFSLQGSLSYLNGKEFLSRFEVDFGGNGEWKA